jgi:hypothetical protein
LRRRPGRTRGPPLLQLLLLLLLLLYLPTAGGAGGRAHGEAEKVLGKVDEARASVGADHPCGSCGSAELAQLGGDDAVAAGEVLLVHQVALGHDDLERRARALEAVEELEVVDLEAVARVDEDEGALEHPSAGHVLVHEDAPRLHAVRVGECKTIAGEVDEDEAAR